MSISPQLKEVEEMLIHHFGAETHGFKGLVDQKSLKNHIFCKKHFLRGFQFSEFFRTKARNMPMHIINENIFFDLHIQLFEKKNIEIHWNIFGHNLYFLLILINRYQGFQQIKELAYGAQGGQRIAKTRIFCFGSPIFYQNKLLLLYSRILFNQ